MNGKVIPHTPIAVDFWQLRKCSQVRLFFLSHMHSDHTVGLTSTWSNRPIYCSPVTATLLQLKLQVKEKWIHALEVGESHLLSLDDIGKERMTVTLIDANHCPGAVMFFFEGYFGTILYTGDFRYAPSMLREPCLRNSTSIDALYLDNTNCDPTRSIPTRQRACQQIKEIIRAHPSHAVVIGMYTLGKESLLVQLAMEFRTWVEVDQERLETLRVLDLPDVFTADPGSGRIRAVPESSVTAANLQAWNRERPTLALLPTSRPVLSCHPKIHVVPYSDHSSYQELEDFVSALRPASLVPIVAGCVPPSFCSFLQTKNKKRREILVPESVRRYMNASETEFRRLDFGDAFLPRRPFRPAWPRGVVFESPDGKSDITDPDCDSDSESDVGFASSDRVLLDMSPEVDQGLKSSPQCLGPSLLQIVSEDDLEVQNKSVIAFRKSPSAGSMEMESLLSVTSSRTSKRNDSIAAFRTSASSESETESFLTVASSKKAKQNESSSAFRKSLSAESTGSLLAVAKWKKKSPPKGSINPRASCSSMDSIHWHDSSCMATLSALTPSKAQAETSDLRQSYEVERERVERWLVKNFTIPEEEMNGKFTFVHNLHEKFRLAPLNVPKPDGDPIEAAIRLFKSK